MESKTRFKKMAGPKILMIRNNKEFKIKKYFTLLLFSLITNLSFGQTNYQEVVYLKNGSIIRGVIIEQVPNKSIKIETADKSIFVFQMDEIEKITKEIPHETKKSNNKLDIRKGFIGLTLGPSIPVGAYYDWAEVGAQLNLINFGYRFSENFGITATWFGAANHLIVNGFDPWSYGGLMVGPLISVPLSKKVEWNLRPMIGYSETTFPDLGSGIKQTSSVAFNLGTLYRINVGKKAAILLSADYFSTNSKFENYNFNLKIRTISFGVGAAFTFK